MTWSGKTQNARNWTQTGIAAKSTGRRAICSKRKKQTMSKKKDGFADLAAAFAKVYSTENAAEVFDGSYEDQVRNPAFIGMLLYMGITVLLS